MPTTKKFHFLKLFFQLTIQFSPTGSRPVQLGWARMGLMSQGKYPSTQSHYPGKINTKGNCYCHRLLHPWGGGGHSIQSKNKQKVQGYLKSYYQT